MLEKFKALPMIAQWAMLLGPVYIGLLFVMMKACDNAPEEPKCSKCKKYESDCQCWQKNQSGDGV